MNKTDLKILKRGLKRMGIGLLTASTFLIAVLGFILAAFTPGYVAVPLFLISAFVVAIASCMLYGMGLNHQINTESKGEGK